ncbi:S1 family peptidase [Streptomyces sp. DG2A-72]|uniref:S1 family peptidase n=1 Tax=Streptomyces sp. DG2A-72 TaxID=3051386 RepID=UPI00265C745A|nr:S1 family peptidase [Streptomyces sp. DG2A-72]MDO0935833.1 S1 family peptidase [Streptomyces sp. DG2A-72]
MLTGIGCLLALLTMPPAHARETPEPSAGRAAMTALADELGDDRTGGVYRADGRLVVAVTDAAAAETIRNAGGTAKLVAHSMRDLKAIHAELDQLGWIGNTAWGVDPSTNQVSVELFDGVSAADRARIEAVTAAHPGAVRIDRLSGTLQEAATPVHGGMMINPGSGYCSAGFNVQGNTGNKYLLTAGHCARGNDHWYVGEGSTYIGRVLDWNDRPGDWAVVNYLNSDVTPYGTIRLRDGTVLQIDRSGYPGVGDNPGVGDTVRRTGATSQDMSGTVLQTDMTMHFSDGATREHMIETTLCLRSGDSGGPLFYGTTALGITSGALDVASPCSDSVAGRSYYYPVQRLLDAKSMSVY